MSVILQPKAVLVAMLALALAGCTATPSTPTESSGVPSGSASAPAADAPSTPPLSALPATCGDLFSDRAASEYLLMDGTLKDDQSVVQGVASAGALQAGLFHCVWGGESGTDGTYDQRLVLDVLPDGAAAFNTAVWEVDDGAIPYPDGSTTSEYLCPENGPTYADCFVNVLVAGYWAHAEVATGAVDLTMNDTVMPINMQSMINHLIAVITGAAKSRAVAPTPTHTLAGAICDGQPLVESSPTLPADSVAVQRSGALACDYSGSIHLKILPGGAWSLPVVQANGRAPSYSVSSFEPTSIRGADLALWGCGDGCYSLMSIGGSAVQIDDYDLYGGTDDAAFVAELPAVVAAVIAAG